MCRLLKCDDSLKLTSHSLNLLFISKRFNQRIIFQRTLPLRHKEIYGINVHPTVKFALDFGMALISDKIRKRVKLYSAPDDVEIDKSLLPQEYGGTMPMKEMIGKHDPSPETLIWDKSEATA